MKVQASYETGPGAGAGAGARQYCFSKASQSCWHPGGQPFVSSVLLGAFNWSLYLAARAGRACASQILDAFAVRADDTLAVEARVALVVALACSRRGEVLLQDIVNVGTSTLTSPSTDLGIKGC
jgi:hypothetical protein